MRGYVHCPMGKATNFLEGGGDIQPPPSRCIVLGSFNECACPSALTWLIRDCSLFMARGTMFKSGGLRKQTTKLRTGIEVFFHKNI